VITLGKCIMTHNYNRHGTIKEGNGGANHSSTK